MSKVQICLLSAKSKIEENIERAALRRRNKLKNEVWVSQNIQCKRASLGS